MGVATAIGVGMAAGQLVSAGMSFAQAAKQRKLMNEAQKDADKAMAEARKKLEVNYYDQLSIQKEPYELQREALLSAGAQAIQAGVESERGAAATAGRVQMGMNEAQQAIRTAEGQEMSNLEKLSAQEDSRLRDVGVNIDLEEVAGAQLAARDAQQAAAASTKQGTEQLIGAVQTGLSAVPLYTKNIGAQKQALSTMSFTPDDYQKFGNVGGKTMGPAASAGFTNLDFEAIGQMNNSQYKQFLQDLTPLQKQLLFTNEQYLNSYNAFNPYGNIK